MVAELGVNEEDLEHKVKYYHAIYTLAVLLAIAVCIPAQAAERIHFAVGPGRLYPDTTQKLLEAVDRLYEKANPLDPNLRLLAIVAPHSALGLSGGTAALAFKNLKVGQYDRVIVLAAGHFAEFEGCSIAGVEAYETPLGLVPVDLEVVDELSRFGLISTRAVRYRPNTFLQKQERDNLHEAEHSIEMMLPFLQTRLGHFKLVPIVVGKLNDSGNKPNENVANGVAHAIKRVMDERTLIVVSTELTHYGIDHKFLPVEMGIEKHIEALDARASELIRQRDFTGFQEYLDKTGNKICGETALKLLFKILPPNARGLELGRSKEADILGNWNQTISYAAINFYDPTAAPLPGGDPAMLYRRTPQVPAPDPASETSPQPSEDPAP